jgi:hypothetical protein
MRMESKDGRTILSGEVKDQPHLFGVLTAPFIATAPGFGSRS